MFQSECRLPGLTQLLSGGCFTRWPWPHFKCSTATCGQWLLVGQTRYTTFPSSHKVSLGSTGGQEKKKKKGEEEGGISPRKGNRQSRPERPETVWPILEPQLVQRDSCQGRVRAEPREGS